MTKTGRHCDEQCGCNTARRVLSRRELLQASGLGFGTLALAGLVKGEVLLGGSEAALYTDLRPRPAHFPATAKAVIQLMQVGGPAQMDLFDPKPELTKYHGQQYSKGIEKHFRNEEELTLMGSPFKFHPRGECGMPLSEVIPHLGAVADELCLVRSMHTGHNNHGEGLIMLQTGKIFPGKPVMGSWISYALGSESQNLPAYIVLRDPTGYSTGGKLLWSSGWLSPIYQGTEFSSEGSPVHHIAPSRPLPPGSQRESLDLLAKMNSEHQRRHPGEPALEARIQNYELAARMQLAATDVTDLSQESEATRKLYGLDDPITAGYGTRCLMARRLVEGGVRFVQVFPPNHRGPGNVSPQPWDHHGSIRTGLETVCGHTDQPAAALITDLKERGLLESTIVLWTGEFGRLPISQGKLNDRSGRDHNRHAFSLLLAGGGFRKGLVYGETDEFGYKSVVDRVSVANLHATILHTLGLDHKRLTYSHNGVEESLTDARLTKARVVEDLLESPPKKV